MSRKEIFSRFTNICFAGIIVIISLNRGWCILERKYIAIDLKSYYASVECAALGLDPLTTNLVVADSERTEKTICLAVTPALKAYGIGGRARLFEVVQKVNEINAARRYKAPGRKFSGFSSNKNELDTHPELELKFITAKPRMALYKKISVEIYNIYLKYIAPEDIYPYSVDEVFIDATHYLDTYKMSARELASTMISDVLRKTGITATAGIGTNMYLCKVAMDIMAKHIEPDKNGVRIAELDEMSYRRLLWQHRPLTDFWRVGPGYAKKLEANAVYTMGDIARCSLENEEMLYRLFGVNAELLIDHAWGWEPCTIAEVKAYKPENNSTSSGQVLQSPYPYDKALIVIKEMAELSTLDLVEKGLVTNQIVLDIVYDVENLKNGEKYAGEIVSDRYGRRAPKPAHGTVNIGKYSSSTKEITEKTVELFERIVNKNLSVRKLSLTCNHLISETEVREADEQLSLFDDYEELEKKRVRQLSELEKEKKMQKAMLKIKGKYGKNAVIKGLDLQEGATTLERNSQIGGHKA